MPDEQLINPAITTFVQPPKKRSVFFIAAIIVGAVLIVAGGATAAYFFYFNEPKPETVVVQAVNNVLNAKTMEMIGEARLDLNGLPPLNAANLLGNKDTSSETTPAETSGTYIANFQVAMNNEDESNTRTQFELQFGTPGLPAP